MNEIEKKFSFYNEEEFFEVNEELNLSSIEEDKNDISNTSNIDFLCENEIKNMYEKLKKINNDYFSNKYFRLFLEEDNNNNGNLNHIYCIPKVMYEKGDIIFIYRNEKIKLELESIIILILNDKMFIDENEKEILKQAYFCQIHNKQFIKYCHCNNNICQDCLKDHSFHIGIDLKKKDINENDIKNLQNKINHLKKNFIIIKTRITRIMDAFFDLKKNKYTNNFTNKIKKLINKRFNRNNNLLSFNIYINIIKSLILENQKKDKNLFNYHLSENLLFALKFIKEPKDNPNNISNKKNVNKKSQRIINSFIPFYSDDNKSKPKSNIFICVTKDGYIIIFSFNFYSDNLILRDEENNINNEILNIIKSQYLGKLSPLKIMRLEKCFIHKDYPNIFLVSFPSSSFSYSSLQRIGCVKIVGILDDFSKIAILKIFEYDIGLINALEIKLNDNYYLLNCTNGFTLWFYDSIKNEIKNKKIIPKKYNIEDKDDDNDDYKIFKTYKNVLYCEKRNLLIIQISLPTPKILFYNINNENNEFNIIFHSQIIFNNEKLYFSDYHMNSCIFQEKYLLIGTKIKKEKNKKLINDKEKKNNFKEFNRIIIKENNNNIIKAGIYIVDLDNKKTQIEYIDFSQKINYIIPFKENILICNFESLDNKGKTFYSLSTFIFEIKNEKIKLEKKKYTNGRYQYINSDIIMGDFIICSSLVENYLIKIYKNGKICPYLNIFIDK